MTGKTSNSQQRKSAKQQRRRATAKKQKQGNNPYQSFVNSAPINSPVLPTEKPLWIQLREVNKQLITLCGKEKHLEPILHVFEGLPQKKESDYAPTPIDWSKFATVYKLPISDGAGGHVKDKDGNEIMQQHEAITDVALKHTLEAEYASDLKNAKIEWKNQVSATNAIIPILEACFHERIIAEIESKQEYKTHRKNRDIDKMLKCINDTCAVTSNSILKFKPYEKFKEGGLIFRTQQQDGMSTEEFVTYISDKVDAHDKTTSRLWYGTPILVHFLEKNNKTLDEYLDQFTDVERKRYEAKALEALKAFIFTRGCKCAKHNIMSVELEKLCAHGLSNVFPLKLNDAVRLYKQQYMPKPNKNNRNNNNNNNNKAGKKNEDDDKENENKNKENEDNDKENEDSDEEKQEEGKYGGKPAITAHFPPAHTEDRKKVDHNKDPDRAATMLHEIREQAKLGWESDSEDSFTNDKETIAICALFGPGCIDVNCDRLTGTINLGMVHDDDLDSIDDDDEDSIGGQSPLMIDNLPLHDNDLNSIDDDDEDSIGGQSPLTIDNLPLHDNNLDSINDNDEDSIGGESPLAVQLRDDNLPTETPTEICHTALPDSSDLDRVLLTFPTVPSTARSGCPTPKSGVKIGVKGTARSGYPTPKSGVKIGVKGKPGVQEMNPKKPGVKPEVQEMNPKKLGVKPEKHSRSGYHKNTYYTDSGASNHVVFNANHLDDKLQEGLGYPSDVDLARAIKYNILGRTINNIRFGSNNKGMLDEDVSYHNDNNASDEAFMFDEKKVKEKYKRDRILDEAEENIDGYQDLQGNRFDQVIDEVSEAVDYEAEDKEVFEIFGNAGYQETLMGLEHHKHIIQYMTMQHFDNRCLEECVGNNMKLR